MKRLIVLLLAGIMAAALVACNTGTESQTQSAETAVTEAQTQTEKPASADREATEINASAGGADSKLTQAEQVNTTANVTSNGAIDASGIFSDRDLAQTADLSEATYYTVADGKDISITSAGVYVISGSASNASIVIDAGSEDKVQLVLNGLTINNSSSPAIYVKNADKVFVTTTSNTTNSLTVSGSFASDGDTNTDAVIFSKDDLVLNGLGTLNISSTNNGVTSKDDLKITGGTINITCSADALEANESIAVADGRLTIKTDKDGLHAENGEDDSTGYIYICGGELSVTAGSDGIQATTVAQIDGGTITANASEGIEATFVQINGGTIQINASDDGINASNKSGAYSVKVELTGGDITVNMGQGDTDGVDSNGDILISGGTVSVNAQSPFDYDGQAQHSGGTIIVNGSQTDEITNQMMGGMNGGRGGMNGGMEGGMNGNMNGNRGGFQG